MEPFKSLSDQPCQDHSPEERRVFLNQQETPNPMANPREVLVKINGQDIPRETKLASLSPLPSQSYPNDGEGGKRMWKESSYHFSNHASNVAEEFVPSEPVQRRYGVGGGNGGGGTGGTEGVVLIFSSNSSRLMDPPEQDQRSQRLIVKSGILAKGGDLDEDDPFLDDDLPEEYKKKEFTASSAAQLVSLILVIAVLASGLGFPSFMSKKMFELEMWKWELMILVLISGRLVSGCAVRIVVFFIERNFLLRKRVLYFVYGVRNAVENCIWSGLILIVWNFMFDKKIHGNVLPIVTRIWVCLLVGALVWLLKTLLVKVLASSFHVSTFFDRIQESLFNQYVIETLSVPPLIEIDLREEEEEVNPDQNAGDTNTMAADLSAKMKNPKIARSSRFSRAMSRKLDEGITIDHLHRLNQKNVSAWNMKRLMNIVRKGVLSTLDEQIQDSNGVDESVAQITRDCQAKSAAKKIFYNVAKPGSKYIYREDLMRFLREDEASKTMRLFEGPSEGNGISKQALKNWVVNAFRERRALSLSLNDTKTAVNNLHQLLNIAVGVTILAIWLIILKIASTHLLVFLATQILLVVFVFGNTCKTIFEAIIFLFVVHPFDVGDLCEVDGVQMVVEEMNILSTVFLRYDNQKIIYPNKVLATKPIRNYYRSSGMGDAVDFSIHIATPMEKIAMMKERITRYVESRSDHWYPAPVIVLSDVVNMNKVKISVWVSHRMNYQNMGERWARRALLVEDMIKTFKELDIEYRMLPLDVTVFRAITSNRI